MGKAVVLRFKVGVLICILGPWLAWACTPENMIITPTQTVVISTPSQGVIVGTPTPIGSPGPIASVGVGFFGGTCTSGGEVRNNSPMKVGCRGDATATPKDAAGTKLEPVVHGPDCTWTNDNPAAVTVFVDGDNPFNSVIEAKAAGTARICATVKQVTGCMTVVVVP